MLPMSLELVQQHHGLLHMKDEKVHITLGACGMWQKKPTLKNATGMISIYAAGLQPWCCQGTWSCKQV